MHWFKNSSLRLHGLKVKQSVPETPSKPLPSHSLTLIPAFCQLLSYTRLFPLQVD